MDGYLLRGMFLAAKFSIETRAVFSVTIDSRQGDKVLSS